MVLALAALRYRSALTEDWRWLFDQGFVLTEAMRLSRGELPYADYFTLYGPLEPLLLALPTALFGPELALLIGLRSLCWALGVVCLTRLAARCASPVSALGTFAVALSLGWLVLPQPSLSVVHAVPLLLARGWAADERGERRCTYAAGLAAAVTALFRWDVGGLVFAVGLFGCAWAARRRKRPLGHALGPFVLGFLPALLGYAVLVGLAGPEPVLETLAQLRACAPYRSLPLFQASSGRWAGLAVIALGALLQTRAAWVARRSTKPRGLANALALLLLLGLLPYGSFRADADHLVPAAAPAAVGLAHAFARLRTRGGRRLLLFALAATLLCLGVRSGLRLQGRVPVGVPGLRGLRMEAREAASYRELLSLAERHLPADGFFYSGPAEHARHLYNDALLYALVRHPVPTRYHQCNPGITTTESVQREMLVEFSRHEPALVARRLDSWHPEANRSARAGSSLLDEYLRAHYREVWRGTHHALYVPR